MKNIQGTTKYLELFNKDGKRVYRFGTNISGDNYECTYDEKGNELTYKNSYGYYGIKEKQVTKEEYEAFINGIPEYTMEELINKLGHNFKIKK